MGERHTAVFQCPLFVPGLFPMPGNIHDPVLPRDLLFVVALVLCGGVGVINVSAVVLTLGPHGVAMGVEARLGIEDSSAGSTNATLVVRVDNIGHLYLTVLGLPVTLLGYPFFWDSVGFDSLPLASAGLLGLVLS